MACWPWRHTYQPVSARVMEDVSFGSPGTFRTEVLRVCDTCGQPRTRRIKGQWTLAEVQGRPTAHL